MFLAEVAKNPQNRRSSGSFERTIGQGSSQGRLGLVKVFRFSRVILGSHFGQPVCQFGFSLRITTTCFPVKHGTPIGVFLPDNGGQLLEKRNLSIFLLP